MLETYAVGVKLDMASNVSGVLDRVIRDVERFSVLVKESSSALDRLGRDLRELRTAGGSINSLIRSMEKLNNASNSVGGAGQFEKMAEATRAAEAAASGMTRVLRENATLAAEISRNMQAGSAAMQRGGGGGGSRSHGGRGSEHNLMMAGMGAGIVGGALLGGVSYAMTPAIDVSRTRDVLAADMRLSPEQVDGALARARETTKLAPGTTTGENLASILDLKNVFGDLGEAQKMLPEFARMSALFGVLDRKGGGSGDQAFAAAKAMEIMGAMVDETTDAQGHTVRNIDPELGLKRLKLMERVAVATNMRVQPSDYLGFAKQARVAGMTLSDEFTYEKLPALLQVLGGQRTGTALMSMAQVFAGGKLTPKSLKAMQEIGLAGKDGVYDVSTMMHDPLDYVAGAQKRMEAKGITGTEAQITALMKASQRTTIAGILADLLKDMPAILKEQANIQATRPDMAEHMAQADPAAKVQQFEAALKNLATELGSAGMGDAMKVLDSVTAGLTKLTDWAHDNPGFARLAFDAGAGLGAIATGLGALSTAILVFGPALRLLGVVGGAGAGSTAAGVAGAAVSLPAALLGATAVGAIAASLDPEYGSKVNARDVARGRAGAAAARSAPSAAGFTPADGFGLDGRPGSSPSNPLYIQGGVAVTNPGDIERGVTAAQVRQLARPSTGTTGGDPRLTPDLGLLGVGP